MVPLGSEKANLDMSTLVLKVELETRVGENPSSHVGSACLKYGSRAHTTALSPDEIRHASLSMSL